ncbi:DUF2267 domain-containing protein [Streptomyces sp. NBC_00161]|uniref:DUF2267 domain-containing protein n=1 Tax=Streptomyces sp. NBC_00161 TaxID=2975671 RepID=UPI0032497E22
MLHQPETLHPAPGMTYDQVLETVRYEGAYPTRERAEEAARHLVSQVPAAEPLTGWAFVKDLASRRGATPATTRWETGAVLAVVARLAGPSLLARILDQLPEGWALLFGQAQLLTRSTAA